MSDALDPHDPRTRREGRAGRTVRARTLGVGCALDSTLSTGAAYFQDLWGGRDSDDAQREVMRALATGRDLSGLQNLTGLPKAMRQLVNRDILEPSDGTYRFRVELVRRWVEQQSL